MIFLKMTKPDTQKKLLLLESGVRFHTTRFERAKDPTPSGFSMKLRKHIRGRKLVAVRQLGRNGGMDRVIDFEFGFGDTACHLILELYASGNIILTDFKYRTLTLLRAHSYKPGVTKKGKGVEKSTMKKRKKGANNKVSGNNDDASVKFAVREVYPMRPEAETDCDAPAPPLLQEGASELRAILSDAVNREADSGLTLRLKQELSGWHSKASALGTDLVEHCIAQVGLSPAQTVTSEWIGSESAAASLDALAARMNAAWEQVRSLDQSSGKGFIYSDDKGNYCDFSAIPWAHRAEAESTEFPSVDAAADEYFSKRECEKDEKETSGAKNSALKKVEFVKKDHERRVAELERKTAERMRAAELVAKNSWVVGRAIEVIQRAVNSGMDWEALDRLLERERAMGDEVAAIVVGLKLEQNKITLLLREDMADDGDDDSDSDSDSDAAVRTKNRKCVRPLKVDVDIRLSAHANARNLFEEKKMAKRKAERTIEASEKVIRDLALKAERSMEREVSKRKGKQGIREARKVMWFEKFDWFVTSEGLLVISGKDAQQNELLVKRYLRESHGDVYVHADLHGAATCILRNPFGRDVPLPVESLRQAGAMTVCRSAAWSAKVIAGAWWVHASQVSKTAPTGEYLSTGSFMIRGKKNYLPPCKLEMGFGYIFKVDETQMGGSDADIGGMDGDESENAGGTDPFGAINPPNVWRFMYQKLEASQDTRASAEQAELLDEKEESRRSRSRDVASEDAQDDSIALEDLVADQLASDFAGLNASAPPDGVESAVRSGHKKKGKVRKSARQRRAEKAKHREGIEDDHVRGLKQRAKRGKQENQAVKQLPRGKRGKLKKAKRKYRHQDEEERKLAMKLLGHKFDEAAEEEDAKSNGEAELRKDKSRSQDADIIPQIETFEEDDASTAKHGGDEDRALKYYTACPRHGMPLVHALPFCGPISAMQFFKYRVKLTPGSTKRGRAVKTAVEVFSRLPSCESREKELIRQCADPLNIAMMRSAVKLTAPGLGKIQKEQKKAKKLAKKNAKKRNQAK